MSPTGGSSALGSIPIAPGWDYESLTVVATDTSSTLQFVADAAAGYDIVALSGIVLVDLAK
jgi:hypothetical protein